MQRSVTASLMLVLVACGGETPAPQPAPSPSAASAAPVVSAPPPPMASAAASAAPATPEPPKVEGPKPAVTWGDLSTPESVLYDAAEDRYLVSNINGKPLDVDGNGFISILTPDGGVKTAKWIEGGRDKVKLDAPKGMAIFKGTLFVADITVVRTFDMKTGKSKGDIPLKGATFLNDVAAGPDGKIYVSDSGMKAGKDDFEPTKTDTVWVIEGGKPKVLAKGDELSRPNGLLVTKAGLLVNTFGGAEVFLLDGKGKKQSATKTPKGGLDGLGELGDELFVSSWQESAIYRGKLGGEFTVAVADVKAPADFAIDTKRKRLIVPRFLENKVEAWDVK